MMVAYKLVDDDFDGKINNEPWSIQVAEYNWAPSDFHYVIIIVQCFL